MTTHSSPSFSHDPHRLRSSAAIGTRKFSVNSSDLPTTTKTNPMPNAIAPASLLRPRLECSATAASVSTSAAMPNATSNPPTIAVAASSSTGRDMRRRPSSRVRS